MVPVLLTIAHVPNQSLATMPVWSVRLTESLAHWSGWLNRTLVRSSQATTAEKHQSAPPWPTILPFSDIHNLALLEKACQDITRRETEARYLRWLLFRMFELCLSRSKIILQFLYCHFWHPERGHLAMYWISTLVIGSVLLAKASSAAVVQQPLQANSLTSVLRGPASRTPSQAAVESISFNPSPLGKPCYSPISHAECAVVNLNKTNDLWISDQPGGYFYVRETSRS